MLFNKEANSSPNVLLEPSSGLVKSSVAADAVWRWALSGAGATGSGLLISEDTYVPADSSACSSIYSVGDGRLAVILNGIDIVSSVLADGTGVSSNQQLSGEPASTYIDVWTVKLCAGCDWITFINDTEFFQNNAVILTTPLLFSTKNRLFNKKIELGSIEKLKIGTEVIIENKDIDNSVKNVLKDGLITSGAVQIMKHNDADQNLQSWITIYDFAETASAVEVTGDNTFLYTFDTTVLTDPGVVGLKFGSATGTYSVQLKYSILDETRLSPLMYFTVV
tara:strand:+ start:1241 stop:2077 length:837 start_codon:yes stop_codon:yes gene_type:complete